MRAPASCPQPAPCRSSRPSGYRSCVGCALRCAAATRSLPSSARNTQQNAGASKMARARGRRRDAARREYAAGRRAGGRRPAAAPRRAAGAIHPAKAPLSACARRRMRARTRAANLCGRRCVDVGTPRLSKDQVWAVHAGDEPGNGGILLAARTMRAGRMFAYCQRASQKGRAKDIRTSQNRSLCHAPGTHARCSTRACRPRNHGHTESAPPRARVSAAVPRVRTWACGG